MWVEPLMLMINLSTILSICIDAILKHGLRLLMVDGMIFIMETMAVNMVLNYNSTASSKLHLHKVQIHY